MAGDPANLAQALVTLANAFGLSQNSLSDGVSTAISTNNPVTVNTPSTGSTNAAVTSAVTLTGGSNPQPYTSSSRYV